MSNLAELHPAADARAASADTLSRRIETLLPQIAAAVPRTEADRRVSDEIIEALRQAGMFRIYVPKAYGGTEESVVEVVKCIRMVARVCPSTAWVIGVLSAHPFITSLYSKEVQDEFWADGPDTLASTSGLPVNKARIVDGGIRVSGRFPFSSGCVHASWAQVGISVPDITKPRPERMRTAYFCLVPRKDYRIEDTWHVMGLAGTGSRDLIFDDVFIPSYRMEVSGSLTNRWSRGADLHKGWLWNAGYQATIGTALPPVSLGIADAMLEMITKRVKARTIPGTRIPLNSVPSAMRLAESTHDMQAISLFWNDHVARLEARARAGFIPDEASTADFGGASVYVQMASGRVVDRLYEIAGGTGIRLDNPVQRFWRDSHAARSHISADYDAAAEAFGRHIMELPPVARWG